MRQHHIAAALAGAILPFAPHMAQAQTDTPLPEVQVKASTVMETATGPVTGYRAQRSASGTKTDTPLAETPQSVSVVPRALIEDIGAQTLQDTLRYVPGVRSDAYGFDNRGDWALIRGTAFTQYQ
ncbi:MAG: TonB-dependent receptor plug domain-containing protein, partial [Noviherbaspirillum sp.]